MHIVKSTPPIGNLSSMDQKNSHLNPSSPNNPLNVSLSQINLTLVDLHILDVRQTYLLTVPYNIAPRQCVLMVSQ